MAETSSHYDKKSSDEEVVDGLLNWARRQRNLSHEWKEELGLTLLSWVPGANAALLQVLLHGDDCILSQHLYPLCVAAAGSPTCKAQHISNIIRIAKNDSASVPDQLEIIRIATTSPRCTNETLAECAQNIQEYKGRNRVAIAELIMNANASDGEVAMKILGALPAKENHLIPETEIEGIAAVLSKSPKLNAEQREAVRGRLRTLPKLETLFRAPRPNPQ